MWRTLDKARVPINLLFSFDVGEEAVFCLIESSLPRDLTGFKVVRIPFAAGYDFQMKILRPRKPILRK